jgi:hypothetical protein
MLDFRTAAGGVGVNQESDASGQGARNRNFRGMQQGHDIPAEVFSRSSGNAASRSRVTVKRALTMSSGSRLFGVDQGAQQHVGGRQNFAGIVPADGSGPSDSLKTGWRRHET